MALMAADGIGDLSGQGWTLRTTDTPEGSWTYNTATDKTATMTLPASLSAGTWYIFLYFADQDQHRSIYFTLGSDTSDTIFTDDRDPNGYWSVRATLSVITPGSTLIMHVGNNGGTASQHMFRGLYLTTNASVTVLSNSVVVDLTYPTVMDDSAAVPGNLIANGSFEVGVDAAWGVCVHSSLDLRDCIDTSTGHSGTTSLKLPCGAASYVSGVIDHDLWITSRVFHLKPNKTYTFSAWVKTSTSTCQLYMDMNNTFTPPAGSANPRYMLSTGPTTVGTSWTRVSVSGYAIAYVTADFNFLIRIHNGLEGQYVYVDDVQLEEGSITTYADAIAPDALITTSQPGHVFYHDDTLTGTLKTYNGSGASVAKTLQVELYDWLNRQIRATSQNISLASGASSSASFDLSTGGKTGQFRLVYWVDGVDKSEKEMVYSIVPHPATSTADTASYIGIHPDYVSRSLAAFQKLGVKWARTLSPAAIGRWSFDEPTEGTFVYHDTQVNLAGTYGITTLCTIGVDWPAYADSSGVPNLTKWATFVSNLVNHYKAITTPITYWEIWNEPLAAPSSFSANFYAQILKTAVDAIEGADSSAKIIAMGGLNAANINSVLTELATLYPTWTVSAHVDYYATHNYPGGVPPEELTTFVNGGMPVWNTESGAVDCGNFLGPYANFTAWGRNILPFQDAKRFYQANVDNPNLVITTFTRTIAAKQTRFFYYDGRITPAPDYFSSHYSTVEYDASIRAKGVAYSVARSFIDKTTGAGDSSPNGNSLFLTYNTGSDPLAVLFSADNASREVALAGGHSHSDFSLYDIMGNSLTFSGTTIPYGRIPVYLRATGLSLATLQSALNGGTISTRTDTTAPNISIMDGPRAPLASGSAFRMRWLALDDTSLPNYGEINQEAGAPSDTPAPDAILYSYRLSPYSTWSAWVPDTFIDYTNVPNGRYTFEVKAKDQAANESAIASRSIQIGSTVIRRSVLFLS